MVGLDSYGWTRRVGLVSLDSSAWTRLLGLVYLDSSAWTQLLGLVRSDSFTWTHPLGLVHLNLPLGLARLDADVDLLTWCWSRLRPRIQRIWPRGAMSSDDSSSSGWSIISISWAEAAPSVILAGRRWVGIHVTSWTQATQHRNHKRGLRPRSFHPSV